MFFKFLLNSLVICFSLSLFLSIFYWTLYALLIQHDEDYEASMRYIHEPDHLYSIYYKMKNLNLKYDAHEEFHKYLSDLYWPLTKEKSRSLDK